MVLGQATVSVDPWLILSPVVIAAVISAAVSWFVARSARGSEEADRQQSLRRWEAEQEQRERQWTAEQEARETRWQEERREANRDRYSDERRRAYARFLGLANGIARDLRRGMPLEATALARQEMAPLAEEVILLSPPVGRTASTVVGLVDEYAAATVRLHAAEASDEGRKELDTLDFELTMMLGTFVRVAATDLGTYEEGDGSEARPRERFQKALAKAAGGDEATAQLDAAALLAEMGRLWREDDASKHTGE